MSDALPASRSGRVALALGLAAPGFALIGALLASRGLVSPFIGFRIFAMALPLALLAILVASVVLFRARSGRNPAAIRMGLTAMTTCVMTVAAVAGLVLPTAGAPLINDICTDPEDPPQFTHAAALAENRGRDLSYPSEFASQQRQGYPTLDSLVLDIPPEEALARVREALDAFPNTEVTHVDAEQRVVEARSVSRVFRFVDDLVIRVRPGGVGSVVDARSKSRVGKGDMGANAARIESLFLIIR